MRSRLATAKAVIYGLACGDALGAPTEFMHVAAIREKYGPTGITDLAQTSGRFTDDTQMAVAVAEGILDAQADLVALGIDDEADEMLAQVSLRDPSHVMPFIAKRFVEWAFGPDNNRAPGMTCMAGCRALRDGVAWDASGVPSGRGCGGMMRAAPVALVYGNVDEVALIAEAQARATHGHLSARQAAQLTALCVYWLAEGVEPGQVYDHAQRWLVNQSEQDTQLEALIHRVRGALVETIAGHIDPADVMVPFDRHATALGTSWVGDEAFASALYCFLLAHERGEGYVEAVRYGANTDGDSDSIACVAGAFAGACWGLGGNGGSPKGVPEDWIDWVEDSVSLGALATSLESVRSG